MRKEKNVVYIKEVETFAPTQPLWMWRCGWDCWLTISFRLRLEKIFEIVLELKLGFC